MIYSGPDISLWQQIFERIRPRSKRKWVKDAQGDLKDRTCYHHVKVHMVAGRIVQVNRKKDSYRE